MYPRQFLDSFWSPELRKQALVAMSFDDEMRSVYDEAIEPACSRDNGLAAVRVDLESGGDSVVTRILDGIAHSKLVIAEISTRRRGDPTSRNGNVMWEVGVAHAFRQSDEVVLLRHDDDRLLFDIGQIRVHKYDRRDLPGARAQVGSVIRDRLACIELTKSMLVDRVVRSLGPDTLNALLSKVPIDTDVFQLHVSLLEQDVMGKLCGLGVISFAADAVTKDTVAEIREKRSTGPIMKYRLTAFGRAVVERLSHWPSVGSRLS